MLVIVSDLHLTDGTAGSTVESGAFEIFAERVRELAVAASWRSDGRYRPIERIDLVLLGDILDVVRSAQWAAVPGVRPWGNSLAPEFVDQVTRITTGILRRNEKGLAVLRGLTAEGGVTVPPVIYARAGAEADAQGEPVQVRLHYMVGNHDWYFHLADRKFDPLRQKIVQALGLANPFDQPFPHDMTENEELLAAMRRHKVTARHGDLFDPLNFEGDRDAASLGDVIVIELVNRFAAEVETQLAGDLPASTVLGLREIDNIRPILLVPVWIDGLLERTCAFPGMRKRVKAVWDRMVDEFLGIEFVRRRDTISPVDVVDGLQRALRFSKRFSIGWASAITEWLNKIRGSETSSYCTHALAEQDFRNRRSRHIVYGHTHLAETVALDASYAEGYVLHQEYFNTGTWRRIHRQTQLAPAEHEFIAQDVMSYAVFYQGDERRGRPYETWNGTLGFNPCDVPIHRVDPGQTVIQRAPGSVQAAAPASSKACIPLAAKQPPAPSRHGFGPHFLRKNLRPAAAPPRLMGLDNQDQ